MIAGASLIFILMNAGSGEVIRGDTNHGFDCGSFVNLYFNECGKVIREDTNHGFGSSLIFIFNECGDGKVIRGHELRRWIAKS
jgi:hypothetical protein